MASDLGKQIDPPPTSVTEFDYRWRNWANRVYEKLRGPLWFDNLAILANAQPRGTTPALTDFGPTAITRQYAFDRGEGLQVAFHINHDIKPGSKIYPHVHWSTDGVDSGDVEWVLDFEYAKGHDQEAFATQTSISLVQTASSTAWQHMIVEATDEQAFVAPEPDTLILMKISRGSTNDTYPNPTGIVFGLYVDLHYQVDRFGTPKKDPRDRNGNITGFYHYGNN